MMNFDVVVVGAGPAGSLAAREFAKQGYRVGLFDGKCENTLSHAVIVETESRIFEELGIPSPSGDEIPYHAKKVKVFSARYRHAYSTTAELPICSVYLDRFAKKVCVLAQAEGAQFFPQHQVNEPIVRGDTVRGVVFRDGEREVEVFGRLIIDATGFRAAIAGRLPRRLGVHHDGDSRHVVVAGNAYHRIDRNNAQCAIESGTQGDEEIWNSLGPFGAYSTEFSHLSLARERAYVLIGAKADHPGPSVDELLERLKKRLGYFGEQIHGATGPIRIRHAIDQPVANGFMAIGEAGGMINPMLASGVATGLRTAKLAAAVGVAALAKGEPTIHSLWPFAWRYQRGRGATFASLSAIRMAVETFTPEQHNTFIEEFTHPLDLVAVNAGLPISVSPRSFPKRFRAFSRHPEFRRPLLRMAKASVPVYLHYRRYPKRYQAAKMASWCSTASRLFGRIR